MVFVRPPSRATWDPFQINPSEKYANVRLDHRKPPQTPCDGPEIFKDLGAQKNGCRLDSKNVNPFFWDTSNTNHSSIIFVTDHFQTLWVKNIYLYRVSESREAPRLHKNSKVSHLHLAGIPSWSNPRQKCQTFFAVDCHIDRSANTHGCINLQHMDDI